MKRMIALILALSLVLCACGSKPAETTVPPSAAPETTVPPETAAPPTSEPAPPTESTAVDTNPVGTGTNPLTGEALEGEMNRRPTAIMINNLSKAVPQCGISKADVIYEIIAEGSVTRFMAIFYNLKDVGVIGPVRSTRPYFIRVAQHYGAILTSAGGSEEAFDLVASLGWDYLNGIAGAGDWFYRDEWRRANRGFEHSLMTTGSGLVEASQKKGFTTTVENADYGLTFTEEAMTTGENAKEITVWFYKNGKKSVMAYDESTGLYTMSQHGDVAVDGNDNTPITFRNILILEADSHVKDEMAHLEVQMTGTGKGYYARDGKIIPITWSRESNTAHYVYTDASGNPISLGVGKTYVAITPDGSPLNYK